MPGAMSAIAFEGPIGDMEETLVRIWQKLPGLDRVDHNRYFFEIGGFSLLLIELAGALRRNWL
jgi:hypothetical protein